VTPVCEIDKWIERLSGLSVDLCDIRALDFHMQCKPPVDPLVSSHNLGMGISQAWPSDPF
ncbi:MAG: hypothetical protein ABL921_27340, partial [Pirellula sp.]